MNENTNLDDILQQVYERSNEESQIDVIDEALTDAIEYNAKTVRFSGADWYNKVCGLSVFVGGAGGICSNLIYLLARLNLNNITVQDPDIVSIENMAGQLYHADSIGIPKVSAISKLVQSLCSYYRVYSIPKLIDDNTVLKCNVVLCGFDNMEARKCTYYKWKKNLAKYDIKDRDNALFIDGRLTLDELQVFCITGNDTHHQKIYEEEYLFSSNEAEATSCSTKQTAYTAFMIASIMTNLLVNFVSNMDEGDVLEKALPFKTYYNSNTLMFKCYG